MTDLILSPVIDDDISNPSDKNRHLIDKSMGKDALISTAFPPLPFVSSIHDRILEDEQLIETIGESVARKRRASTMDDLMASDTSDTPDNNDSYYGLHDISGTVDYIGQSFDALLDANDSSGSGNTSGVSTSPASPVLSAMNQNNSSESASIRSGDLTDREIVSSRSKRPARSKSKKSATGILGQYAFGREEEHPRHVSSVQTGTSAKANGPSYFPDFDPELFDHSKTKSLKFGMVVDDFPVKSRVETQIRLSVHVYPPPNEPVVHLPMDTISKPKLQLKTPFIPNPDCLMLNTVVCCASDLKQYANMCKGCIKRERKRALRKKVRLPVEDAHWNEKAERRVIVLNCREVINFSEIETIQVNGKAVKARRLDLPLRLACYCRHHNEKVGFRVFFSLQDFNGNTVARGYSNSVIITDDHKGATPGNFVQSSLSNSTINSGHNTDVNTSESDEISSTRNPNKKRKSSTRDTEEEADRLMRQMYDLTRTETTFSGDSTGHTSPSLSVKSDPSTAASSPLYTLDNEPHVNDTKVEEEEDPMDFMVSKHTKQNLPDTFTVDPLKISNMHPEDPLPSTSTDYLSSTFTNFDGPIPIIQQVIPAQGPIRGGIDVTLLGSGFVSGLITKFGENRSPTSHCWNSTTMVTQLPPAQMAGTVKVSLEGWSSSNCPLFRYFDDTDRQLVELALQIVGLKMNGRLETAREVAQRIVSGNSNCIEILRNRLSGTRGYSDSEEDKTSLENDMLTCMSFVHAYKSEYKVNISLRNKENHTMLHLATILGLTRLCVALVSAGLRVNARDVNGYQALHFAAIHDRKEIIHLLLSNGGDITSETYSGHGIKELMPNPEFLADLYERYDKDPSPELSEEAVDESAVAESSTRRRRSSVRSGRNMRALRANLSHYFTDIRENFDELLRGVPDFFGGQKDGDLPPPSYEEIYPEGSDMPTFDYDTAAIDDLEMMRRPRPEKRSQQAETSGSSTGGLETESATGKQTEIVPSDEQLWREVRSNQRKLVHDQRLFFFWLPILIFLIGWVSTHAIVYIDDSVNTGEILQRVITISKALIGMGRNQRPDIIATA